MIDLFHLISRPVFGFPLIKIASTYENRYVGAAAINVLVVALLIVDLLVADLPTVDLPAADVSAAVGGLFLSYI